MIIVLVAVLAVALGIGAWIIWKYTCSDMWATITGMASLFAWFAVIVMLIAVLTLPISVKSNLAHYEGLKTTLEDARLSSDDANLERAGILAAVVTNNQVIQEHRDLCNNIWVGCFYSKQIAELDYILLSEI